MISVDKCMLVLQCVLQSVLECVLQYVVQGVSLVSPGSTVCVLLVLQGVLQSVCCRVCKSVCCRVCCNAVLCATNQVLQCMLQGGAVE